MFKKVVSMSLAVVAISICATGEVVPQNLGSIKVTTPMYTADQVDEIVSEGGQSRVALTNGTIYINGETITPLPTTMNDTTATVEKLSIVYPGWDTNNIAPIRIKHNEDGSFDLQIIGTNTYLFGANGANLYWNENSTVSLKGTNELSGYTRITQDFVAPAFRIPRNEFNLHAKRKFRFDESANARIEIGGQGEMRVDSPDYIKFGGIDWSENLWNASNKTLTAYISDRLEDFSKNGTVPAIKSNDGSYMIDATGCVWRITLVENISDWVLGGDGYLTTGSDNYPIWNYSTRWYKWYWTVTNNESVITIDMPAEGYSAQYMVDVNYDYYASSLGMYLLYEDEEEYEELIQKGFPENLDFTRTVVRYYTTNLVGKIALEEEVRNYNDISVDTNTWYLLKPDLSVEPMIFAQQTHRYIRWSTEDGNFDLNLMFSDSTWALTVNRGLTILVTNSMDVTSLEFTNYVPPYETYHVIRGSRLALNTEIPQDYSSVSNAAMNAMPRAEARFTPWKPYEEQGAPAGYQLVSAVYSGNRWHLKIMVDGETTPTTYTTDDSMDAVMITFDGELNSLVRSRLASIDDLDDYAQSMARNMRNLIDLDLYMPSDWYYGDIVAFAYDKEVDRWIGTNGLSFSSGHLIKYDNTAGEWIYYNDIYGESYPEQRINGSLSDVSLDLGSAIIERETAFIKIEGKLATTNDLASALATYETVSNAAMSAATKTEPITGQDGNWHFDGEALTAMDARSAQVLSENDGLYTLRFQTNNYRWESNEYYGLGVNYFAYLSDISAAATAATNYTDSAVAFAPVSPSEQTGSYQLADRSVNAVDITDNQVLIMPAPVSGKLRDLYVRAQFNGVASQANLSTNDIDGTSVSFEYEDGIIPTFDRPGTYLLHIMETAAGTFSVNCDGPMVEAQYDKRLEYVSSTGTQYVDTGIIGSSNTVIEIDMAGLSAVANVAMFGAINSENRHFMAMRYNNALRFIYGTSGSSGDISVPVSFGEHTRHQFRFSVSDGGNVKIDVDGVNKVDVDTGISSTTGLPMFLFGCNRDSSLTYPATMSIYGCRIWKDGNIVRNYIPCMKDNRAALFDTITHTLSYSNSGTDLEPAASTAEETSLFAGFSLPEYVSTLSKYKYDPSTRTCYREFVENDTLILRAVTNIDLTAVGNIDALKTMEDSIEIRKPPVAQVCYSVGYESRDNVLVATNANFKIDGNYLSEATITMSYDVSGTTTAEIISPTAITATSESITIAESALATARSEIGRTITFTIQTAYGHTSITAVVAEPPTP